MEALPLKQQQKPILLAQSGVIAAAYVALTLLLQPICFGSVQCRLSEMLTILPVYTQAAVPGLTVGCFLSNLIGLSSGVNPAGAWDLLFGTVATLSAALLTRWLRGVRWLKMPIAATLPPVIVNAVIVGAELFVMYGGFPLYVHMLLVGAGQVVSCTVGGSLLALTMEKSGLSRRL